jgi:excinuclease ABC subunit A
MPLIDPNTASDRDYIIIRGARVHNLKNVHLALPRDKFIVFTGLSGSGKSSLAFDTLYAEGQRRYVESLSAYARQFMGKLDKPDVDAIDGIAPAIAIEQKVISRNARSTVGTSTEIYDYIKLLYARIGKTISPISGNVVKRHQLKDVIDTIDALPNDAMLLIAAPTQKSHNRTIEKQLEVLIQQGYSRIIFEGKVHRIEDALETNLLSEDDTINVVIDRVSADISDEDNLSRISDSVETAFNEGNGICLIINDGQTLEFSNRFELDGMLFEEPSVHFFTFNNPIGACKTCEGFGSVIGIDPDSVIPDKSKSVHQEAIVCWKGEKMSEWLDHLLANASQFDFPIHRPYRDLTPEQQDILWNGNEYFEGINAFFKFVEANSYKIQYRVMLSRYRGKTICPDCKGTRLRKDAGYVKVGGKSVSELVGISVEKCLDFFKKIELNKQEAKIAERLLTEIISRLGFLCDVGLGYLTLNRLSNTLSGGESQRINLATSLGSSLVGSMYILDEPSIGLHSHDTQKLITVLQALNNEGNTLIVVEHDEEVMEAADMLIDLGPEAGRNGGEIVFQGSHSELINYPNSLTAKYLTGQLQISVPEQRRKARNKITLHGVRKNNLNGFDVSIPLGVLTVITGVSGSGKTTLVKDILYPAIQRAIESHPESTIHLDKISGDINALGAVEYINQNPIGKSSRSNPVTYVKAFDDIRTLLTDEPLAKTRRLKPSHFSFNVDGGRCETCKGEGEVTIEMQFMADIHLVCETCKGKRFKDEILEIKYNDKNVADILALTIDEAIEFFGADTKSASAKRVLQKLLPLQEVGLGYAHLGQSSNTLSGGEAQRIKLASFLIKGENEKHTLFIFDEPTTGLHFHDVQKLLIALNALIDLGHTVLVIEHNLDVIKNGDWIIDLGPGGGENGGQLVFSGTPEDLVKTKASLTAKYLGPKLGKKINAIP